MKPISISSSFVFKGVTLMPGDHIAFRTSKIPLPHVEAAVTHVDEDGRLHVFSTLLAPFAHIKDNGIFSLDEVGEIEVVYSGDVAVPMQARNVALRHGQRVKATIRDGRTFVGILLAAFDGIVTMWPERLVGDDSFVCDMFVVAGSKHFVPA